MIAMASGWRSNATAWASWRARKMVGVPKYQVTRSARPRAFVVEAAAEARHQQRHAEHQRGRQHRDDEASAPPLEIPKRHPPHAAPLSPFRELLVVVGGIRAIGGKEAHRRIDRGATTPAGIVAPTFPARAGTGTMAAGFRRGAGMR
jgi:hypothetical protein